MDYREKLKVKLEEKFFKPNKKIIDRFNEEYEYYQGKNMIKSMYLLSIIKEELEKKDINLIIGEILNYSLIAYILGINDLCPLDNELSEKYGIFGFGFTQYKYVIEERKRVQIVARHILDDTKKVAYEVITLLDKLNFDGVDTDYINKYQVNILIDNVNEISIRPCRSIRFFELNDLFSGLNLKSKIKDIINYEVKADKKLLKTVFNNNDFYCKLIDNYEINSNERLYRLESVGHSTGVYSSQMDIDRVIVSREELYKKLLTVIPNDEAFILTKNISAGKYHNNNDIVEYLVNKGIDKVEISSINCEYMSNLFTNIDIFLYYKALIYLINKYGYEFYNTYIYNKEIEYHKILNNKGY